MPYTIQRNFTADVSAVHLSPAAPSHLERGHLFFLVSSPGSLRESRAARKGGNRRARRRARGQLLVTYKAGALKTADPASYYTDPLKTIILLPQAQHRSIIVSNRSA